MMPDFAMGFWQCKLRYQTQEELLAVAREYKRRGLPISVIVVDFFHWPTQGDWRFDPTYWPDPEAMIAELKGMGIELMVSVWPTVDYRSENFAEMRELGYLIRTERGIRVSMDFQGNSLHFDATEAGGARVRLGQGQEELLRQGHPRVLARRGRAGVHGLRLRQLPLPSRLRPRRRQHLSLHVREGLLRGHGGGGAGEDTST